MAKGICSAVGLAAAVLATARQTVTTAAIPNRVPHMGSLFHLKLPVNTVRVATANVLAVLEPEGAARGRVGQAERTIIKGLSREHQAALSMALMAMRTPVAGFGCMLVVN